MALSNTAVPKYYGQFREAVLRGEIPVCREVAMEMNRVDDLIADPNIYYDPDPVEGWIAACEGELTLTDGSDFHMLDTFKLWGEQIFGWYYFIDRSVYEPNPDGHGGHYVNKCSSCVRAFGRMRFCRHCEPLLRGPEVHCSSSLLKVLCRTPLVPKQIVSNLLLPKRASRIS